LTTIQSLKSGTLPQNTAEKLYKFRKKRMMMDIQWRVQSARILNNIEKEKLALFLHLESLSSKKLKKNGLKETKRSKEL
jgi:hypothetical protein